MNLTLIETNTAKKQELKGICDQMRQISNNFYKQAVQVNNHAFIEFTGLMNEYINVCLDAIDEDIDFTQANIHTGKELPFKEHHKDYINEKLTCIYGIKFQINNY